MKIRFFHANKKKIVSKTTAPQQVIFSTIIIFKLCKFNVNLWTLCFLSYKKYIHVDPLKPELINEIQLNTTSNFCFEAVCKRFFFSFSLLLDQLMTSIWPIYRRRHLRTSPNLKQIGSVNMQ